MFARDELLRLIREKVHHPATARELAQLLRVPREERTAFKGQIRALAASGELLQIRGNRYGLPEEMNLVVGKLSTNPAGFGFVVPEGAKRGDKQDVYIAASNLTEAMHGDRVVARVERDTPKGLEGRIIRILERSQATLVGRYEIDPAGLGYVVPFDRRVLTDVHVPTGQSGSAEPGEMVLVELTRWPTRESR
jgi:ribonuclease R